MKKFQFGLEHVRDYRDRLLEEELGKLQRLKAALAQVESRIQQLNQEFSQVSAQLAQAQRRGTTSAQIQCLGLQLEAARLQLRELEAQRKKAQQQVDLQTRIVVEANQEVSKLDKLKERQLDAYRTQAAKAEEQQVEELVSQSHARKAGEPV